MNKNNYIPSVEDYRDRYYVFDKNIPAPESFYCAVTKVYEYERGTSADYALASYLADRSVRKGTLTEDFEHTGWTSLRPVLETARKDGIKALDGSIWTISEYGRVECSSFDMKWAIVNNGPLIACLPVYNESELEFWRPDHDKHEVEHHCVVINGFEKDRFLLKNCWGRDWGNNGHHLISQGELAQYVIEIWSIIMPYA